MIQTVVRGWFARRLAQKKREDRDRADEEEYQARVKAQTEAELNHKYEIQRRMKPRTKEDFHILHSELEAWRSTEATKIKQATDDTDVRQAANRMLLHKEVKLLQTIDRLKGEAQKVNKDQKIKQELDSMAAAKVRQFYFPRVLFQFFIESFTSFYFCIRMLYFYSNLVS